MSPYERPLRLFAVLVLALTAGVFSTAPGRAQTSAAAGSGAGLENLPLFAPERLSVEINLEGSLLAMVAGSVEEEDPEFARLISGLRSIKVRITEVGDEIGEAARQEIRAATGRLRQGGWKSIVQVQEDDEEIFIFLQEDGQRIGGLIVFFFEIGEEAGLIQIDGDLDPALLGTLARSFDSGSFEALTEALGTLNLEAEAPAEKEPKP